MAGHPPLLRERWPTPFGYISSLDVKRFTPSGPPTMLSTCTCASLSDPWVASPGNLGERERAKSRTRLGQCWNDPERNNQGEEIYAQKNLVDYRVRRRLCRGPVRASTGSELLRRPPTLRLLCQIHLR